MAQKIKPGKVSYVPSSEVFDGRPFAKDAFENECEFSYGENDLSLVQRDKFIKALQDLDIEDDDTKAEVDECIEYLQGLDATIYIDLEDM